MSSTDIYYQFSELLSLAQQGQLDLLDSADQQQPGLLSQFSDLARLQLSTQEDGTALAPTTLGEQEDNWTFESNTWSLVQALYAERLDPPPPSTASASSSANPYTPPLPLISRLLSRSAPLLELSAIRDWLHSIPTSLNPSEIRRGYLPYTKNKLKQARRVGAAVPRGLVSSLDPDATVRGLDKEERVEGDDAAYERALLRSLFEYVRAGELDLAIDMCRQSDQSWRAASLSGGKLWDDPALSGNNDWDDNGMEGVEEKRAKGCKNRRQWKKMCRAIAATPGLDPYERALYGAISGDLTSVLPVCTTWADVLWAHVNAQFESRVEALLWTSSEGRYFSRGSTAPFEGPNAAKIDTNDPLFGTVGKGLTVHAELEQVFDALARTEKGQVGIEARNPFCVSQTYLILGKIGDMVEVFVERLESAADETEPETLAHLLRFFAHLVLVLRLMDQPLPSFAANRVLEAYVKVLEANDQDENLIAFYASHLDSPSAVESYARFLLTFGPESDIASRRLALLKAHEHGLDLASIARRTVELVLSSIREELPTLAASTTPFDAYASVTPRQLELIRSLEWLTFDPSTYADALSQANALARWFLSSDAPSAARLLHTSLPPSLLASVLASSSGADDDQQIREFADYRALFDCLELHGRWTEVWSRREEVGGKKGTRAKEFADGVATLVDEFYDATVKLFESDWLKLELDPMSSQDAPRRLLELASIRTLLIPHLFLRLHHTLFDTSSLIPTNLPRTLGLANLLADERYGLYHDFVNAEGGAMEEYLVKVREVAVESLGRGKSVFEV